ncbi:MAG: hypothetical protein HQM09_00190 [Candidatus Riflebacteria bacterium]|nr:hypothetical protein [Candidatus Riflebacteria bacterium]
MIIETSTIPGKGGFRSPFLCACIAFFLLLFQPGCGKHTTTTVGGSESSDTTHSVHSNDLSAKTSGLHTQPNASSSIAALEEAAAREASIATQLQNAAAMMKTSNLEGALRLVQRIQQENSTDPYVGMQANYLKAMIYHRQKDGAHRKEAMNAMLKSLEMVQKDPKYKTAVEDGRDACDVIRMSLERGGKLYAHP